MKPRIFIPIAFTVFLFSFSHLSGQDFTYTPKSPAFGGEVFNYQWMLNSANAQNTITEESNSGLSSRLNQNPVDDFANDLQRQILNQLSRQLVGDQFGSGGLTEGSYTIGGFQIDVSPTSEGLSISILDTGTGDQTLVVVPYY